MNHLLELIGRFTAFVLSPKILLVGVAAVTITLTAGCTQPGTPPATVVDTREATKQPTITPTLQAVITSSSTNTATALPTATALKLGGSQVRWNFVGWSPSRGKILYEAPPGFPQIDPTTDWETVKVMTYQEPDGSGGMVEKDIAWQIMYVKNHDTGLVYALVPMLVRDVFIMPNPRLPGSEYFPVLEYPGYGGSTMIVDVFMDAEPDPRWIFRLDSVPAEFLSSTSPDNALDYDALLGVIEKVDKVDSAGWASELDAVTAGRERKQVILAMLPLGADGDAEFKYISWMLSKLQDHELVSFDMKMFSTSVLLFVVQNDQ